jgi:hypothetical protein
MSKDERKRRSAAELEVAALAALKDLLRSREWNMPYFFFSRSEHEGRAFYPFMSTIRQSEDPALINAVVLFESSWAHLYPLREITIGDEIVLFSVDAQTRESRTINDRATQLLLDDHGSNLSAPIVWSSDDWQVVAAASARSAPFLDALTKRAGLVELLRQVTRNLRVRVLKTPIVCLDLIRLEFMLLAIDPDFYRPLFPTPSTHITSTATISDAAGSTTTAFAFLKAMGIDAHRAPAVRPHHVARSTSEGRLQTFVSAMCGGRLAFTELFASLKQDSHAVVWQEVCFQPPVDVYARVSRQIDRMLRPYDVFDVKSHKNV